MKYCILAVVLFFQIQLFAQEAPRSYIAHKTKTKMNIDGKDLESDWQKAPWSQKFVDIEGVKTPKYETKLKMLWDDTYIYFFAKLKEPHIWGTLKQRDTVIFYNNDFEIFIDPDGDTHNYYEFEMNALNTVWDLFLTKPYREDEIVLNHWDIRGLKTAVHIQGTLNNPKDIDEYWSVEIAIPWRTVLEASGTKDIPKESFWRMNFSRVNWDFDLNNGSYVRKKDEKGAYLPEYNWVWSPQGVINMHEPEKWGYVFFSSKGVTDKSIAYNIPDDEKIKWYLYKLYRQQKKEKLSEIEDIVIDNRRIKVFLEEHKNGWNLWVKSPFTQKILLVTQDGEFEKR